MISHPKNKNTNGKCYAVLSIAVLCLFEFAKSICVIFFVLSDCAIAIYWKKKNKNQNIAHVGLYQWDYIDK